jgi:hypothetical protein
VPDSRGSRFVLEVLFLLALAVGLWLAALDPIVIAGVMFLGWVIVAAIEWAAWRGEPHYGAGLPPRYYVPTVNLPPAQPLEQVGYPESGGLRDEAPTWIASAQLRAEMLGEWPVAAAAPVDEEIPAVVDVEPVAAAGETEPELAADEAEPVLVEAPLVEPPLSPPAEAPSAPEPLPVRPPPDPEPELPPAALEPLDLPEDDPWVGEELPPAPLDDEAAHDDDEPDELTGDEPAVAPELAPALHAEAVARYSLDPLAEPPVRRRFGRGAGGEAAPVVEVPARPDGARALPGRPNRQD